MSTNEQPRILVVDDNPIFRETLAEWLRAAGYSVITADTGERAFLILRDRYRPVGWLYARAALPGLIDGCILADEYHDTHPRRAVVLAASEARSSVQGDVVLKQPSPAGVFEAIRHLIEDSRAPADDSPTEHRRAA